MQKKLIIIFLVFALGLSASYAFTLSKEKKNNSFEVEVIAEGLEYPWGMVFLPNGDLLVTEREGRLRRVSDGKLQDAAITGLPDNMYIEGQGGLLDVTIDPEFSDNNLIYLSYAGSGEGGAGTEVAKARLNGDALEDLEVIFKVQPKTQGQNHYGSRLLFDNDGLLYVTLGDRYSFMDEAQNTTNHLGSIVRIKTDGSFPLDNPFFNDLKAKPEIYAYGVRNAQGIALRPSDGVIWYHEHGPRGGDELNILKAGANYGWPAITYGIDYSGAVISEKTDAPGMEQPVVFWDPSIAPSGMDFYTGDKFPEWKGDIFLGALAHRHLRRLKLEGDVVIEQEVLLKDRNERIRAVKTGPDGFLYVLTDSYDGTILRLQPRSE
ncbi:MAG: PQQ-dependent sugar dehydrogenase [Alcanivorax sp.]